MLDQQTRKRIQDRIKELERCLALAESTGLSHMGWWLTRVIDTQRILLEDSEEALLARLRSEFDARR